MQVRDVKRLIDAMAASDLSELEYEQRDGDGPVVFRIRLRRDTGSDRGPSTATALPAPTAEASTAPAAAAAPVAEAPSGVASTDHLVDVAAPIVGTFYASPAPDAGPYVKVGDRVQAGTVLCIIEAMKLMNEIESEVAGTIVDVLVSNEEPVEYGQVLFRIDPG
jgi:acetyl-CoA carboxylase biotin carboxyl carrier protein